MLRKPVRAPLLSPIVCLACVSTSVAASAQLNPKNAIDVGSRPYGKSSFLGKPIGIISNSPGPLGGVNAAKHLQNILPGISGPILGQPEIYLNGVGDAFDDKGELTKEALQKVLQQYIDAFAAFVEKQNR